jgi:glycosyltransferase involved in cell wall biosynthesis
LTWPGRFVHNRQAVKNPPALTVSVVIPVYNERDTVRALLDLVLAQPEVSQVVVVDDHSTDGTREILAALPKSESVKVLTHPRNQGKAAALRTGFAATTGDVVLIQDADLEYDPADYPLLLSPIMAGKADVVFGSRFLGGPHRVLYFWHYLANRFLTLLSNMFTGINLTDMEVCYKVFRRQYLSDITLVSDRFGIEPELTAKLARTKARIYEVPVSYHGRTYEEGKKIGWRDGLSALYWIVRFGLFP